MSSAYGSKSSSPSSSLKGVKASATATAGASRPSSRSSDPYYGHEGTSVLCARFITALFQCPHIPTDTKPCVPPPPLAHFVAYALFRTRLPSIVTFAALLLLQRLKIRIPAVRGSSGHRLFISAFMIASKVLCDETYSNQSWGIVAQEMFVLKELNQMEREMCGVLEWDRNVLGEEVIEFEASVRAEYGVEALVKASCPASSATHFVVPKVNACRTPRDQSWPLSTVPTCAFPLHGIADGGTVAPSRIISITHPPPAAVLQNDSPPPPHFTSAESSLVSSPASEDCKTPSPFAVTAEMRQTSEGDYCRVCQHELAWHQEQSQRIAESKPSRRGTATLHIGGPGRHAGLAGRPDYSMANSVRRIPAATSPAPSAALDDTLMALSMKPGNLGILSFKTCAPLAYAAASEGADSLLALRFDQDIGPVNQTILGQPY